VADEDLVEREDSLPVALLSVSERTFLDGVRVGGAIQPCDNSGECLERVAAEDAVVAKWVRVDRDDELLSQVLRDVGDKPVLPDDDDEVVGGKEEPLKVVAINACATLFGWQDAIDGATDASEALMSFNIGRNRVASGREEELRLAKSSMAFEHDLKL
jgi:hypothetical protein